MTSIGDISLDGKGYRIDLKSYRVKDIIDFAPRATVPGNSVLMSDLSLYQPLNQTDWQHGFGFQWYSDASGYMRTIGNVDTRHDGLIMMYTRSTISDTDTDAKSGFISFNGAVYAYGACGLRKYESGAWTDVYTSAAVNFAINAGDYLFYCPDGGRIKKLNTSGVSSDAGVDANSTDYRWLLIHNGFIYAGKDGTNLIHYDSNADLSQLEGTTADTDVIKCGIGNMGTINAITFAGTLYVARPDGLWSLGEDKIARRVLDYSDSISDTNFRSLAATNGYVYFPIRDRIVQWNGARVADVTPGRLTDEFPYVTYGRFTNFIAVDNFLYCVGRTNETNYTESLLAFDGVGWHKLTDILVNATTDTVSAIGYEAINNRIWYHLNSTGTSVGSYYIPLQSGSSFPYGLFPLSGQHSMVTSRMDMGFRRVTKSMTSFWVEARNVTADRYIRVNYSLDGETFVNWADITRNGMTELNFPGGHPTVEFNYVIFRFDFVTDDETQTPILESYTMNFIMRPDTKMGYSFDIVGASGFESDMAEDGRTAAEILLELRDIRSSKPPVEFTGLMGETLLGYLTSIAETPTYRSGASESGEEQYEYTIKCSFVEMAEW